MKIKIDSSYLGDIDREERIAIKVADGISDKEALVQVIDEERAYYEALATSPIYADWRIKNPEKLKQLGKIYSGGE
jgi:hypothetical protein